MAKSKSKPGVDPAASGIRVVASKSCPSLSGNCTIAYKLGRDGDNTLYIRLHENSGGGFFNNDWYPAEAIADALRDAESGEPVTSRALAQLFWRRSANTPAFFAAVLRNEGVLQPYKKTSRRHLVGDLEAFLTQSDSTTSPAKRKTQSSKKSAKTTSRKTTKKTPAKKR